MYDRKEEGYKRTKKKAQVSDQFARLKKKFRHRELNPGLDGESVKS